MSNVSERRKKANEIIKKINKTYGSGTIMTGADAIKAGKFTKRKFPTPSIEVNDMLGGGFCGICELYGQPGVGKTSLAIETIAYNHKNDPEFVAGWLETEGSVTEEVLAMHKDIDMERIYFWRQEDAGSAEAALDISRAVIAQNIVDFLVINSVAGLTPKAEDENDLDKQSVALTARLLSKYLRIETGHLSKHDITILFINQLRDNVGAYGNPSVTTGGRALKYYAGQRIDMRSLKVESSDPVTKAEGMKIACKSWKNRFANPFMECIYYVVYGSGIDTVVAVPQKLLDKGIVEVSGSWWYYKDKNGNIMTHDGVPCKWQGRKTFVEALRKDKKLLDMFLSQIGTMADKMSEEEIEAYEEEEEKFNNEFESIDSSITEEEIAEEIRKDENKTPINK